MVLFFYYFCHCMSLHVCPVKIFVFDSRLANFWGRNNNWVSACSVLIVVPLP